MQYAYEPSIFYIEWMSQSMYARMYVDHGDIVYHALEFPSNIKSAQAPHLKLPSFINAFINFISIF